MILNFQILSHGGNGHKKTLVFCKTRAEISMFKSITKVYQYLGSTMAWTTDCLLLFQHQM